MAKATELTFTANFQDALSQLNQVVSGFGQQIQKMREVQQEQRRLEDAAESAHTKQKKHVESANESLKEMGNITRSVIEGMLGFASVEGVIEKLAEGIKEVRHEYEEMARKIEERKDPLKALNLAARGDASEFARLQAEAQRISQLPGAELSLGQAQRLTASAAEKGMMPSLDYFARLSGVTDAQQAMEVAQRMRGAFGAQAGSPEQIVNAMLKAGHGRPLEEFASAVTTFGSQANLLGGSADESLGLLAGLKDSYKSPERAGRQIRTLVDALYKGFEIPSGRFERVGGKREELKYPVAFRRGILGSLDEFRHEYPAQFAKMIGENPELAGVVKQIDEHRDEIEGTINSIRTDAGEAAAALMESAEGSELGALGAKTRAEAGKEAAGARYGSDELRRQAALARRTEYMISRGHLTTAAISNMVYGAASIFTSPEKQTQAIIENLASMQADEWREEYRRTNSAEPSSAAYMGKYKSFLSGLRREYGGEEQADMKEQTRLLSEISNKLDRVGPLRTRTEDSGDDGRHTVANRPPSQGTDPLRTGLFFSWS